MPETRVPGIVSSTSFFSLILRRIVFPDTPSASAAISTVRCEVQRPVWAISRGTNAKSCSRRSTLWSTTWRIAAMFSSGAPRSVSTIRRSCDPVTNAGERPVDAGDSSIRAVGVDRMISSSLVLVGRVLLAALARWRIAWCRLTLHARTTFRLRGLAAHLAHDPRQHAQALRDDLRPIAWCEDQHHWFAGCRLDCQFNAWHWSAPLALVVMWQSSVLVR